MDGTAPIDRLLALAGLGPRESTEATQSPSRYVCLGCETAYDVQYHVCPECGGFSVESRVATEQRGDQCETASDEPATE
jgi:hypothetical protein